MINENLYLLRCMATRKIGDGHVAPIEIKLDTESDVLPRFIKLHDQFYEIIKVENCPENGIVWQPVMHKGFGRFDSRFMHAEHMEMIITLKLAPVPEARILF
jgi:hypothetical protein